MVWCQWFGVNMGFSDEVQNLMENLYIFEGFGATKVFMEYLNKSWGLCGLNILLINLQVTGMTVR